MQQRLRKPATAVERVVGITLATLAALTATYFALLGFDMLTPLLVAETAGGGRRFAGGSLALLVLLFGWAYAIWVGYRYVYYHRRGTVYTRGMQAVGVALLGGAVVQAVFALLVSLGVESGAPVAAWMLVPAIAVGGGAGVVVARRLSAGAARDLSAPARSSG